MRRSLMIMSVCALFVHTSCQSKKETREEEVKFLVTSPVRMDTSKTEEYVCQIRSISHIELRAQERGYLQKIYIDEGQNVKAGQPLFKIMPNIYEAERQRAAAEANFAEIEYQNTKRLADSDVVAPNELAMAKAKYDKAQAELELAQVHLQFTELRAPFDGIIDRFHVRLGSLVDEGDLLTTLSDNSKMWVYFNVPEAEYLEYMQKSKRDTNFHVHLQMANNKLFKFPGVVETIEADFNNETGNIPFRATFPNPEGLLRHGQTGNILMEVPLENVLVIPQKCTYEVLDKKFVYVIDKEGTVHAKEITVGLDLEDLFVVTDGLTEDDMILLEGLRKVRNGDEIEYEFEEPLKAISELKLPAE
ncbi:MAG: efflux RND transporter periplasmic adaptor subunit [Bacteroidota bacterium]|nr:efflux RND transporter periplasmic adaptor subunit [Bacteroidota bacterium]MDX5404301.1 efflux RND transporter periplasmic adaptor subunit [Bacteroidota bacterium]MDX5429229.1 efflux RND transporter periplasmic adaptor subunit [Bacteroidota bacterium]MDX5448632.1 efflux RND transporter periplasmic adaptor subunit [Bacteroidota bacterium]MDX5506856.1 efflux RND transporter periplasmic adaptor subunit [Bacteroidota bacterium]